MGEPRFSPAELDRIEDALEALFLDEPHALEDEAPHVRARLADYRGIVIASREALPLEEVPEGLLARVLEAASASTSHEELEVLRESSVSAIPVLRRSWWERLRRTLLIPGLAVVGSAALVLVLVRPADEAAAPMITARAPASPKVEAAQAPANATRSFATSPALKSGTPSDAPSASPGSVDDAEAARVLEGSSALFDRKEPEPATAASREQSVVAGEGFKGGRSSAGPVQSNADVKPHEDPAKDRTAGKADKASAAWNEQLQQADAHRRQGDCASANATYQRGLEADDDRIAARANAGLGLCASETGRTSAAEEYFVRARALDPTVEGFIAGETQQRFDVETKRRISTRAAKKTKASSNKTKTAPNVLDEPPR